MAPLRPSSAPSVRRDNDGEPGAYRGRATRHVAAIGRSDSARHARSPGRRDTIELDLKRKLSELSTQLMRAQAGTARLEHRCAAQQRNPDQLLSAPPPQRASPGSSDTTPTPLREMYHLFRAGNISRIRIVSRRCLQESLMEFPTHSLAVEALDHDERQARRAARMS